MKKTIILILLFGSMGLAGCNNINQNQQEFNQWIKTAKKPVIAKWQNKMRGIQTDDDVLLIDANNQVLFLRECDLAIPDTIR